MGIVRISDVSRQTLLQLSEETGERIQTILDRAIEEYRRKQLLEATNAAYSALRANPLEWRAERNERAEWESTLADISKHRNG